MVRPIDLQNVISKVQQVEQAQHAHQHGAEAANAHFSSELEKKLKHDAHVVPKTEGPEKHQINADDDQKRGARGTRLVKRKKSKRKDEPEDQGPLLDSEGHLDIKV